MMNKLYNTHQRERNLFLEAKLGLAYQPESLFSMALYDFDSIVPPELPVPTSVAAAAFHPVEEYKDLSLKEILDLSDDFLFSEEEKEVATPMVPVVNNTNSLVQPMQAISLPTSNVQSFDHPFHVENSNRDAAASKKRSREVSDDDMSDEEANRFRPYQAGQWAEKFEELCAYCQKVGHCLVPHTFKENLPLARWVKRQRYQYKLMIDGKASTMTPERVRALEDIGFVWDSQGAAWEERLDELRQFRSTYMHCNVPSNFSDNPQLATWVKCQRRQYKLHMEGKASNMTQGRVERLESLGFEWELRAYKKARTC